MGVVNTNGYLAQNYSPFNSNLIQQQQQQHNIMQDSDFNDDDDDDDDRNSQISIQEKRQCINLFE
jgi:hypothetical protein